MGVATVYVSFGGDGAPHMGTVRTPPIALRNCTPRNLPVITMKTAALCYYGDTARAAAAMPRRTSQQIVLLGNRRSHEVGNRPDGGMEHVTFLWTRVCSEVCRRSRVSILE